MSQDIFPIIAVDHLEIYVGNARQASLFYEHCFGFTQVAYRGLETGDREVASYVMQQGDIRLVLSTALTPEHPIARHVLAHGDGVGVIALEVPDAVRALADATGRGGVEALAVKEASDDDGTLKSSGLQLYGDTVLKFVERGAYRGIFAPGFVRRGTGAPNGHGVGLMSIDHIVGNVELGAMNRWVEFFADTLGFEQLVHFDEESISTEYSALMSKVMQDGSGKIKFPINEPAQGRRKSQIQEFLDYHHGPGVQHIACTTGNIVRTVAALRDKGIDFLRVPGTYYEELEGRVGPIDEPTEALSDLGILVDRDDDGYLLQIFTLPIEDRPTLFFEVIERHGARGFGEGNFKSLFEAIEREQALRGNL